MPAAQIAAVAREAAADVIAMTNRAGNASRVPVVNSIAEAVLREAEVPVLMTRADGERRRTREPCDYEDGEEGVRPPASRAGAAGRDSRGARAAPCLLSRIPQRVTIRRASPVARCRPRRPWSSQ
jgi:hypothetical protein